MNFSSNDHLENGDFIWKFNFRICIFGFCRGVLEVIYNFLN
ncbi:hypothetical protein LEP1GSC016_1820 [Leptospira borgpetersenii serovar Hardjo-bovis str. Sponselee]|uniref:Uncharacterized protein n=1 Tax=Leptospira borgpetersenii serovar Hardjo-bovis str. Sponselee TaxID=1303729 RepID=M6C5Z8_LEPBO|nr:hypothetical protein LEP1GSC016_1820 [Leptospira borgpetersenii serovar Hardjo-bovis str. Sponselee]